MGTVEDRLMTRARKQWARAAVERRLSHEERVQRRLDRAANVKRSRLLDALRAAEAWEV